MKGLNDNFWRLYVESFPEDERRSRAQQEALMANPLYHLELFENGEEGFLAWWEFPHFNYVDHFAVSPLLQGHGLGSKWMREFTARQQKGVILEVEPPIDNLKQRRVRFYEDLGFWLNPFDYLQPAYLPSLEPVPLKLMSWPRPLDVGGFERAKHVLYTQVYGVEK